MNTLPPALAGDRFEIDGAAGPVTVYVAGNGPPLLLIHSVNAAASAAEVRPLYEHYARSRQVYAPDLPGFGLSDRSERAYVPRLMTDALLAVVAAIRARTGTGPIDALALSLSCEFLARAAVESPAWFRTLALVSPTGFRGRGTYREPRGTQRGSPKVYAFLRKSGLGPLLFRGLARPKVIRYFLRRTWGSERIDETLWRYDVLSVRRPGAELAPLYFLSGQLFSADVHTLYEELKVPVWMTHGVRGDFTDYRQSTLVADRPNWKLKTYPTGAFPHFEATAEFCADYDAVLEPR